MGCDYDDYLTHKIPITLYDEDSNELYSDSVQFVMSDEMKIPRLHCKLMFKIIIKHQIEKIIKLNVDSVE